MIKMNKTLIERLFDMAENHRKPYMDIYRLHSNYTTRLMERDGTSVVETQKKATNIMERWLGYECFKKEQEVGRVYKGRTDGV